MLRAVVWLWCPGAKPPFSSAIETPGGVAVPTHPSCHSQGLGTATLVATVPGRRQSDRDGWARAGATMPPCTGDNRGQVVAVMGAALGGSRETREQRGCAHRQAPHDAPPAPRHGDKPADQGDTHTPRQVARWWHSPSKATTHATRHPLTRQAHANRDMSGGPGDDGDRSTPTHTHPGGTAPGRTRKPEVAGEAKSG